MSYMFNAYVLHVPRICPTCSTIYPKISLISDTGLLGRDLGRKSKNGYGYQGAATTGFPGLSQEVATIYKEIAVEDVYPLGKGRLRKDIWEHHKVDILKEMGKKIADLVADETGYVKSYKKQKNIELSSKFKVPLWKTHFLGCMIS